MLASLDRIVAISSNHFRAADAGQMSLFGASTGIVEEIHLPEVKNVDKREMLNWERELIGLYITDHPLNEYQAGLAQIVSYFSGQLSEAAHEEKVRVAGLITVVRPYTTKTGKAHGLRHHRGHSRHDRTGDVPENVDKVQRQNDGRPASSSSKAKWTMPTRPPKFWWMKSRRRSKSLLRQWMRWRTMPRRSLSCRCITSRWRSPAKRRTPGRISKSSDEVSEVGEYVNEIAPAYAADTDLGDMPPPPDNFPDGWDMEWQPSFDEVAIASKPEPKFKKNEPVTPPLMTRAVRWLADVEATEHREERVIQSMYMPLVKENRDKEHPPRQLTITLRSTGDHERDKRRIKTLHELITAQHGRDKFSFQIFENNKGYLIDFPNDTTRICPELLDATQEVDRRGGLARGGDCVSVGLGKTGSLFFVQNVLYFYSHLRR